MIERRSGTLFLATLAFIVGGPACVATLHAGETLRERIDALVQPYLENQMILEGITVGVLEKGRQEIVGYGHASDSDDRPPDRDTIYEIGAATKAFTGLLLADAVVREVVTLDTPAGDLLPPNVTMPTSATRPITLLDLATHVSGLPITPKSEKVADPKNPFADYSDEKLYDFLGHFTPDRAPGKKFTDSFLGTGLLGHLLALKQQTTYADLLRDRIAKPLKMASTTIDLSTEQGTRLAPPHSADGNATSSWDIPVLEGAGAIRSTARNLLRFADANLDPPPGELGQAIELAWQIQRKPQTKGEYPVGLGWNVAHDGTTRWQKGQTGGYHCMWLVNADSRSSVVVLTNIATDELDPLAEDLMRMTGGVKVKPRKFEKAIDVSPDVMQRYVGKYRIPLGPIVNITLKDDKLMVGVPGPPVVQILARSETEWYCGSIKATLKFTVDEDGKCNALEVTQNGTRQRASRVK